MFSRVAQDFPAACSPSVKGMGGGLRQKGLRGFTLEGWLGDRSMQAGTRSRKGTGCWGGTSTVWRLGPHSLLQSQSPALRTSCAWWPENQSPGSLYPGSLLVPWDQRW